MAKRQRRDWLDELPDIERLVELYQQASGEGNSRGAEVAETAVLGVLGAEAAIAEAAALARLAEPSD